ncbi:MAG: hypothetical protein QW261_05875 [Candidatus Jordarchaeaceae archaeon]
MSGKKVSSLIGGILDAFAGGIGILWCLPLWNFILAINNYHNALALSWQLLVPYPSTTYLAYMGLISTMLVPYPSNTTILMFSALLAVLLIVSGVLIARGFHSSFLKGEGVSSVFPVVMGAGFSLVSGILIVLGFMSQRTVFEINYWIAYGVIGATPLKLPVISLVWLGLASLGIAMISLGWIGIKYRGRYGQRLLYLGGVASTVGGLALLPHFLLLVFLPIHDTFVPGYFQTATFGTTLPNTVLQGVIIGSILSQILCIVGFSLLIVASILWIRGFSASSKH